MRFAVFLGCNIPARLCQYAESSAAVLRRLDVELVEMTAFNCCGYPARNIDRRAFILSAARNLALAEHAGLDILVLCKCCYGSLKKAEYLLNEDGGLKSEINRIIAKEGFQYQGVVQVKHLLSVLYRDVGLERIKQNISRSFSGLQIAVSYGCHALRPSHVTRFDDPISPRVFDELVEITGAFSVEWTRKLDCCGAPLTGINDRLAMDMARKKLVSAKESGAHFVCTACPYTHLQFDWVQDKMTSDTDNWDPIAAILYPQLVGLSMGIDEEALGLSENRLELKHITSFLMSE